MIQRLIFLQLLLRASVYCLLQNYEAAIDDFTTILYYQPYLTQVLLLRYEMRLIDLRLLSLLMIEHVHMHANECGTNAKQITNSFCNMIRMIIMQMPLFKPLNNHTRPSQ